MHAVKKSGDFVEAYSVDAVVGFETSNGSRFEYAPFASFRHRGGMLRHEMPERYFHTRSRRGPSGRFDTWVVLGGNAWENETTLQEETLSLSVTGTNGMLPRKGLREASINRTRGGFTNVDIGEEFDRADLARLSADWRPLSLARACLISHPTTSRYSMRKFCAVQLALYDWTDGELNRRRIEAIIDVKHRPLQKLVKGGLLRGVEIEVTLQQRQVRMAMAISRCSAKCSIASSRFTRR